MNKKFFERLNVLPSECQCKHCVKMCQAPCTGSVEDIAALIEAGYADRLMFDDLPDICGSVDVLKPALKGHESLQAPYAVKSKDGCTFWKEGKCELHDKNLKPILGRLALHDNPLDYDEFSDVVSEDWSSDAAKILITKWKQLVGYD